MLKYYNAIFLLLLCIIIFNPVHAANTTCTPCPPQTPYIVYVTVTVPVPVIMTPTPIPTPIPTSERIDLTPTPPQSNPISQITNNQNYILGGLFLLLIGGVVYLKIKQRKKKPPVVKVNHDVSDLYEETLDIPKIEEEPEKQEPRKKQKKPKSLLDQDFEF